MKPFRFGFAGMLALTSFLSVFAQTARADIQIAYDRLLIGEELYKMQIDPAGSAYLGGYRITSSTTFEMFARKLLPDGAPDWAYSAKSLYRLPSGVLIDTCFANDLILDKQGNVLLTGTDDYPRTAFSWWTHKLDATTGQKLWDQRYLPNSPMPNNWNDAPAVIAVDSQNNVITGGSRDFPIYTPPYRLTQPQLIKYRGADGFAFWLRTTTNTFDYEMPPFNRLLVDAQDTFTAISGETDPNVPKPLGVYHYTNASDLLWSYLRPENVVVSGAVKDSQANLYIALQGAQTGTTRKAGILKLNASGTVVSDPIQPPFPLANETIFSMILGTDNFLYALIERIDPQATPANLRTFLVKIDPETMQEVAAAPVTQPDAADPTRVYFGSHLLMDRSGDVYAIGYTLPRINNQTPVYQPLVVIEKLSSQLASRWTWTMSSGDSLPVSLSIDQDKQITLLLRGDGVSRVLKLHTAPTRAEGDINDDGCIDDFDLFMLTQDFLDVPGAASGTTRTDLNSDGNVDDIDLFALTQNFLMGCQ